MKQKILKRIMLSATFCTLLLALASMAQPPQRIIIGIEATASLEAKRVLESNIEMILDRPLETTRESNDSRWVVVILPPMMAQELATALEKIQSLLNVRYAESDQLYSAQ